MNLRTLPQPFAADPRQPAPAPIGVVVPSHAAGAGFPLGIVSALAFRMAVASVAAGLTPHPAATADTDRKA